MLGPVLGPVQQRHVQMSAPFVVESADQVEWLVAELAVFQRKDSVEHLGPFVFQENVGQPAVTVAVAVAAVGLLVGLLDAVPAVAAAAAAAAVAVAVAGTG